MWRERLWWVGFCKQVSFKLLSEGGNWCCTANILREVIPDLRSIKGKTMAKMFGWLKDCWMERRNCKVLTIWVTMPSTIGTTTKTQERFEVRRRTTMQKFIHKCCGFENTTILNSSEWNRLNFHGRLFVHFSDRWSTHNRLFYSTVMKHIPGWSVCHSGKNNSVSEN